MSKKNFSAQVATAGEALIDLMAGADGRFEPCLGGAVYNLSRALSRQGVHTLYLNPLSKDRFGRQLAAALLQDGVQLAAPQPVQQMTSLAVVQVDTDGHPDYTFYREGVADRATHAAALTESCRRAEDLSVVCTGALALSPEDGETYLPWLAGQRQAGRTVVVDANMRPSVMPNLDRYRRHVLTVLQYADVIKVSDEDLACLNLPGSNALEQARHLLQASRAGLLALTLGAGGAALLTRQGQLFQARDTEPLSVIDTLGAGDCFLAGCVASLLQDGLPADWGTATVTISVAQEVLSRAIASASLSVMQRGCVPPTRAEVTARIARNLIAFSS